MITNAQIRDWSGHDNHGIVVNPEHYRRGLAPIFGEGASAHLDGKSYFEGGLLEFGNKLNEGFYIGFDLQPEGQDEFVLCGTGVSQKTSLGVYLTADFKGGERSFRLRLEIRDDNNKRLTAIATLSNRSAKRILISAFPPANEVSVAEVTLHEDRRTSEVVFIDRHSPSKFSSFERPVLIGGYNGDDGRQGRFVGRLSKICFFDHRLQDNHLDQLLAASRSDLLSFNETRPIVSLSYERRQVFVEDLTKLKRWDQQETLSDSDLKDASVVLFKWLCDRHPLLQDLCDELGIQLSLPGESDRGRNYNKVIADHNPVFAQPIHIGSRSFLGFKWVSIKQFLGDLAFITDGYSVSHGAFIKFVRHKLGGAHFDVADRTKWQRELAVLPVIIADSKALNFHMKELVRSVLEAVEGCRIEQQVTITSVG
jgi:hypothetical protein